MKLLQCAHCQQRVFFENLHCENCASALGFVPDEMCMGAFEVQADGRWQRLGAPQGAAQRPCSNYTAEQVCNWTVSEDDPNPYCLSCRTTQIIPALANAQNRHYWFLLEQAKRRLFYTLIDLRLPIRSKAEDPAQGLSFQFLEEVDPARKVLTGHDDGLITLNIAEANDAHRESARSSMHEPYRTLLGHFRHESGHYYWDRLIADSPWLDEYRALFGDERADYAEALKTHYNGPPADWPQRFVSAYASAHPWEDWAECWAHYLHVVDGLETASAWGLRLDQAVLDAAPVRARPVDTAAESLFAPLIEQWLPVSQLVNAMNRSLGTNDSYPFVLPPPVVEKLEFIHRVVAAAARQAQSDGATPVTDVAPGQPVTPAAGAPAPQAVAEHHPLPAE